MGHSTNEWAPITDADLLGPEEVETPAPQQNPECDTAPSVPPSTLPDLPAAYPSRPKPIYTYDDWRIFHYWVRQKGYSIDMAAACAGIGVYDALVTLQERDPWFYEFAVLIGPQGDSPHTRRRRGYHMGVGGQAKNYERTEKHYKSNGSKRQDGRLTEEEARQRFLRLMGDAHPEDRIDGTRDNNRRLKAVHPATGRKRLQSPPPKKRKVTFTSERKCRHCGGSGHDRRNCKDLRGTGPVPAGLGNPIMNGPEGYEEPVTEESA